MCQLSSGEKSYIALCYVANSAVDVAVGNDAAHVVGAAAVPVLVPQHLWQADYFFVDSRSKFQIVCIRCRATLIQHTVPRLQLCYSKLLLPLLLKHQAAVRSYMHACILFVRVYLRYVVL